MHLAQGLKELPTESTHQNCLQNCDTGCIRRADSDGFTLIETLIVILVIGILCATGISMYAGATADSQLRSLNDELNSFFTACRHRAIMRKTPVKVVFQNNRLGISESQLLSLRIPEIEEASGNRINGMLIGSKSATLTDGRVVSKINLNVILPGNRLATLSLEL